MSHKPVRSESCASCGVDECEFNVERRFAGLDFGRHAWLLDEWSAEFNSYLKNAISGDHEILTTWPSHLVRKANYAWDIPEFCSVKAAPLVTFRRSLAMRRLAANGARRQNVMEDFDRRSAEALSAKLAHNVTTMTVWQNFLPFLHLDKTLGGREYDVLMCRAPRHFLHETLDCAKAHYPESTTLNDFRSSSLLVEAEAAALTAARRIVTPHAQLARLYPEKTTLLAWDTTKPNRRRTGERIGFLGPTIGRRGAYVVRETMRLLGRPLIVIGKNLESENFWQGMQVEQRFFEGDWLHEIGVLLAPAITEFRPRLILEALARGTTVIATEACGLPPRDGLVLVDPYDPAALADCLQKAHV